MDVHTENLLRYEQKRGNIYLDALKSLCRYFSSNGQHEVARTICATLNDAHDKVSTVLKELEIQHGKQQ